MTFFCVIFVQCVGVANWMWLCVSVFVCEKEREFVYRMQMHKCKVKSGFKQNHLNKTGNLNIFIRIRVLIVLPRTGCACMQRLCVVQCNAQRYYISFGE